MGAKAADTAGMTEVGTIIMFECDHQPGGAHSNAVIVPTSVMPTVSAAFAPPLLLDELLRGPRGWTCGLAREQQALDGAVGEVDGERTGASCAIRSA